MRTILGFWWVDFNGLVLNLSVWGNLTWTDGILVTLLQGLQCYEILFEHSWSWGDSILWDPWSIFQKLILLPRVISELPYVKIVAFLLSFNGSYQLQHKLSSTISALELKRISFQLCYLEIKLHFFFLTSYVILLCWEFFSGIILWFFEAMMAHAKLQIKWVIRRISVLYR